MKNFFHIVTENYADYNAIQKLESPMIKNVCEMKDKLVTLSTILASA